MTNRTVQEQDATKSSGSGPNQDDQVKPDDKSLEAPVVPSSNEASGSEVGKVDTGKIDKGI
jgi:hypothetical protein